MEKKLLPRGVLAGAVAGPDLFSRTIQANVGVGIVFFGMAMGALFAVAIGIVMLLLPQVGHLSYNEANFGKHATETPLPLTDSQGNIVYPGFSADVLFDFRFYSVAAQLVLWAAIGLVFGPLAERLLRPTRPDTVALPQEPDPVPA